jgi:small subunit ribosomal protein S9
VGVRVSCGGSKTVLATCSLSASRVLENGRRAIYCFSTSSYLNSEATTLKMKKIAWLPISLREGLRCACSPLPITPNPSLRRRILLSPSSRQFSTAIRSRAGIAAPEIKFKQEGRERAQGEEEVFYARLVPESPSYFTAQPTFIDDLLALQTLLQRYSSLPVVKPGEAPRIAWRSIREYRNEVGESVRTSKYHKIIEALHRLNHIHPSLMPAEVTATLNHYKRDINPYQNVTKAPYVDGAGKTIGHGRRKASTARAYLVEGTGEVLVNGKSLAEAFGRIHDRESVIWALKATDRIDKYNVWALVEGGGTTGQAEALTLAVGKALLGHEPALKPALRRGKSQIPITLLVSSNCVDILTFLQPDVLLGIREELKERSPERSRPERCLLGSRDSFSLYVYCIKTYRTMLKSSTINKIWDNDHFIIGSPQIVLEEEEEHWSPSRIFVLASGCIASRLPPVLALFISCLVKTCREVTLLCLRTQVGQYPSLLSLDIKIRMMLRIDASCEGFVSSLKRQLCRGFLERLGSWGKNAHLKGQISLIRTMTPLIDSRVIITVIYDPF